MAKGSSRLGFELNIIWITYCSWTNSCQNAHVCSGQQLGALYYNKGQKEATRLMKGHHEPYSLVHKKAANHRVAPSVNFYWWHRLKLYLCLLVYRVNIVKHSIYLINTNTTNIILIVESWAKANRMAKETLVALKWSYPRMIWHFWSRQQITPS